MALDFARPIIALNTDKPVSGPKGIIAMAEFENSIGESNEWYTPPEYFKAFNCEFDLDPCSPGPEHWVPAKKVYTITDDGLSKPWDGFVFMNPPFGGRNGHVPWLQKFIEHGHGIGIVRAYTSSQWFHDNMENVDVVVFPRGKTKFIRPDGSVGKSPGHGICVIGMGQKAMEILMFSGLGLFCDLKSTRVGPLSAA